MTLADAIALTVIVAIKRSYITGVTRAEEAELFRLNGPPNPVYRHNAYCVASCVILWPGVVASFARLYLFPTIPLTNKLTLFNSTYIMWKCIANNDIYGPKSSKFRNIKQGDDASFDMPNTKREENGVTGGARSHMLLLR
jgi:hypothetical protein